MGLQPFNWSVVIRGCWNLAILTPGRISKKIFKLPGKTQMKVSVPIDGISPHLVEHPSKGIVFSAAYDRVEIKLNQMNYDVLQDAMVAGVNVLTWLPETPVSAAGFNINFQTEKPDVDMIKMYQNPTIDGQLSQVGSISDWTMARSFGFKGGNFNLAITGNPKTFKLLCNFHRESKENKVLVEWLKIPVSDIKAKVVELFEKLNVDIEETKDEHVE